MYCTFCQLLPAFTVFFPLSWQKHFLLWQKPNPGFGVKGPKVKVTLSRVQCCFHVAVVVVIVVVVLIQTHSCCCSYSDSFLLLFLFRLILVVVLIVTVVEVFCRQELSQL